MFHLFSKKEEVFQSPVNGKIMNITEVDDKVFSEKMMGDGIAIIPIDGRIYAPFSGILNVCFPTGHAYGLKCDDGKEILLHLGIDTVELQGVGFKTYVKQGKHIRQGDLLCEMDLNKITQSGKSSTIIVVFTSGENIRVFKDNEDVKQGEEILEVIS